MQFYPIGGGEKTVNGRGCLLGRFGCCLCGTVGPFRDFQIPEIALGANVFF